ncbi:MAG: cohesin domain-containing protein [Dehalococcoidia bacterium]|nr:cohesin domain-containing protein [Dehalococcoidia bacterium]
MRALRSGCFVIILMLAISLGAACGGGGDKDDGAASDGTPEAKATGNIQVPIRIEGANNVGSFDMVLEYDATVLQATEVVAGSLAQNAMLEFNTKNSGQVIIGIIDSSGITGDGSVAIIRFKLLNAAGTSALKLQTVEAHNATTLVDIIAQTSNGSMSEKGNLASSPLVEFSK